MGGGDGAPDLIPEKPAGNLPPITIRFEDIYSHKDMKYMGLNSQ